MTSKREIRSRIETLEATHTGADERWEMLFGAGMMAAPEPELTTLLAGRGFVVEREQRDETVLLETTPSATALSCSTQWHDDGPTAPFEAVHVDWEADAHADVRAGATRPVVHEQPDLPAEAVCVETGPGWRAVVPADRVVTNKICRRSAAEQSGDEILGPAPSWIEPRDAYDLVEVAVPVTTGDEGVAGE